MPGRTDGIDHDRNRAASRAPEPRPPPDGARQVAVPRRAAAAHQRCDLRAIQLRPIRRLRVPHGGARLRPDGRRGINAVRVYSAPERWLLDLAQLHGVHVMVGMPWEQHIAFLDTARPTRIEQACAPRSGRSPGTRPCSATRSATRSRLDRPVARQQAHRTLPGATVPRGPAGGPRRARHLRELPADRVPATAVLSTSCRSTSTSSGASSSSATSARLQNLADERPLLMAEIGLDSRRNGEQEQARIAGLAARGVHRGRMRRRVRVRLDRRVASRRPRDPRLGFRPDHARARTEAGAAAAVDAGFRVPRPARMPRPAADHGRRSARTTARRRCANAGAALTSLHYPDYEMIVVSDGSTDDTGADRARESDGVR